MTLATTDKLMQETVIVKEFGEVVSAITTIRATVADNPFTTEDAFKLVGVPKEGDAFSVLYPELLCEGVTMRPGGARDGSGWRVEYEVRYGLSRSNKSLSLGYPIRGSASLIQKTTFTDRDGSPILVKDPNPGVDEQGNPAAAEEKNASIEVTVPHQTTVREVVINTNTPEATCREWINWINTDNWTGSPGAKGFDSESGMWLCVSINWELYNARTDPKKYKFIMEFERASDDVVKQMSNNVKIGWSYPAYWRSSDNTVPKEASVDNGGIVLVDWHYDRPFLSVFPTPPNP